MTFSFPLYLLLPLLVAVTSAQSTCPDGEEIIYSPFRPWFSFDYGPEPGDCWKAAICLLGQADPARNQQFAATALVMGLLPMVFRDIAWPERRVVLVSSPLPTLAEVVVRALGLEPVVKGGSIAGAALRSRYHAMVLMFVSLFALLASYAGLALVEIYSKRTALGCVYPIIALTWCLVGVIPAMIHVLFEELSAERSEKGLGTGRY
ncbi:hypothetical protein N7519_009135 [Penicillium mononematosum]|uniref:uncharacterized protein n=1 Tax=Penicillium mononematosum TaxID=268346 RepID=UPI0025493967|nr:uncharacterized protein N7519_009135 [Penicillium mononematosum]KAJ6178674.1 hypothetical protein N7519_009135 [Penicillium mononematosum]